jgi:hypothetical protein
MRERMANDLRHVLEYWLHRACDDDWPPDVMFAMARMYWPGRQFTYSTALRQLAAANDDELEVECIYLADMVDSNSNENAYDLFYAGRRTSYTGTFDQPANAKSEHIAQLSEQEIAQDLLLVLDYWLYWIEDNDYPGALMLSMCRLYWPDRDFAFTEEANRGLHFYEIEDTRTHETFGDLYGAAIKDSGNT